MEEGKITDVCKAYRVYFHSILIILDDLRGSLGAKSVINAILEVTVVI